MNFVHEVFYVAIFSNMAQRLRARYRVARYVIVNNVTTATLELFPVQWRPLDTSVVGDVPARRSKMHGEFVTLKERPVTSRAVFYRIKSDVARPNHCGRHLGKINGHNSTYVKVWRCTFGRITRVLMGKSYGKLLQCQAEMFIWFTKL